MYCHYHGMSLAKHFLLVYCKIYIVPHSADNGITPNGNSPLNVGSPLFWMTVQHFSSNQIAAKSYNSNTALVNVLPNQC